LHNLSGRRIRHPIDAYDAAHCDFGPQRRKKRPAPPKATVQTYHAQGLRDAKSQRQIMQNTNSDV